MAWHQFSNHKKHEDNFKLKNRHFYYFMVKCGFRGREWGRTWNLMRYSENQLMTNLFSRFLWNLDWAGVKSVKVVKIRNLPQVRSILFSILLAKFIKPSFQVDWNQHSIKNMMQYLKSVIQKSLTSEKLTNFQPPNSNKIIEKRVFHCYLKGKGSPLGPNPRASTS